MIYNSNTTINSLILNTRIIIVSDTEQKMVKINFVIFTHAPLPKVWNYFARFENVAEWDPNVKSSKLSKETSNMIGSTYDLVTIFNGK